VSASPVVPTPDRPVQSPRPMASPSIDRVVVPVVVQRDPPPVKYEQPQRWEYTQWDLRPIYPPERPAGHRMEPMQAEREQPSDRRRANYEGESEGWQGRREDPPQRAQGISKESHASTSSARSSSARTSSSHTGERRTEPAPADDSHTTSGRPTHSADSKPSPTQGKPVPGDHPPRKDEKRESRR
jgi:hypothetical protein